MKTLNIRLIISLLTTVILLSVCVGCTNGDISSETTAETAPATTVPQTRINLSEYAIVRPEDAQEGDKNAAILLNDTFEEIYNIDTIFKTDWENRNIQEDNGKKEILVGATNYAESIANGEGLTRKDYVITFTENKIVITGGSGEACLTAVEKFISDYIVKEGDLITVKTEEPFKCDGEYKYSEANVKTVSLNLRTATNATTNTQSIREPLIAAFIAEYKPDSIGVQECEIFWRMRLEAVLKGYARAQDVVANAGTKNYIFYNTETLNVIDKGVFWLSETPDSVSKGFGSNFNISCTWAIFEYKATGTRYVHMNAHLDYSDENIRIKEVPVLIEKMKSFIGEGYAVIVTGDFNAKEDSPIYKAMIEAGVADSRYKAPDTSKMATYNNFEYDRPYSGPIDFCFISSELSASKFAVIDKWNNKFMSDHNALYTELTLYYRNGK